MEQGTKLRYVKYTGYKFLAYIKNQIRSDEEADFGKYVGNPHNNLIPGVSVL